MVFNLQNEFDVPKFKAYVNKLYSRRAVIEVREKRPQRSVNQNSYLHLLLGYFGAEFGLSLEEVKVDIYKRICNKDLFERKKVNKFGREVTYLRSSADLSVPEMTLSITRFRNYASSEVGIYLPEANADAMIYMQQVVERNKEYI